MDNDVDKNLILAKVWNDILDDDIIPCNLSKNSIDLQNNVFRLNLLIQTNGKFNNKLESNEQFDLLVNKCNQYVLKSAQLESYLNQKNIQNEDNERTKPEEVIEVMDTSTSEIKTQDENKIIQVSNSIPEINADSLEPSKADEQFPTTFKISSSEIFSNLNSIKKSFEIENSTEIKELITNLASNFDLNSIQIFAFNMLDIENLKPGLQINAENQNVSLSENNLILFFENLIELNSSLALLSYNISHTFLKTIMGNYVLFRIYPSMSNEQFSLLLSRKIFILCTNLCREFPRQFIQSCIIPWILETNSNISNKIFIEFLIKIVKECFNEQEATILVSSLLSDFCSIKWSESIYNILSNLVDKMSNLNVEYFSLILNKMKIDSFDLAKSAVFSKFLLSLLNKCKNHLIVSVVSNQTDEVNESFSTFSQSSQSKRVKNAKSTESVNYNKNFIEIIESIIENNQTLIKRTLLNLLKSYKS